MYIERMKRRNKKTETVHYHYLLTEKKNGKRFRMYVPFHEALQLKMEKARMKRVVGTFKTVQRFLGRTGTTGRPRIMSLDISKMLESAGFSLRGKLIRRCRKTYFSEDAARIRYDMLDEDTRRLVGAPGKLLELERKALAAVASLTRKGLRGHTFLSCLSEIIYGTSTGPAA